MLEAPGFKPGIRVEEARVRNVGTTTGLSFSKFSADQQTQLRRFLLRLTGVPTADAA